jgi:hypothetical protein
MAGVSVGGMLPVCLYWKAYTGAVAVITAT